MGWSRKASSRSRWMLNQQSLEFAKRLAEQDRSNSSLQCAFIVSLYDAAASD
jgi:hypothetical protein